MKVLVTGGLGFIGSNIVERLVADGHEVTVLDNLHTGNEANVESVMGHLPIFWISASETAMMTIRGSGGYFFDCPARHRS